MAQAKDLINKALTNLDHQAIESEPLLPNKNVMNKLWERMADAYGHRWESSYGTTPNKTWTDGLAGVTPQMIGAGLSRLLSDSNHKTWPPNVFEFRGLCEFVDYGLPSVNDAYSQAVNWSRLSIEEKHPAVLFTLRNGLNQFNWLRLDADKSRKQFDQAWRETLAHVGAGGELQEIPKEITEQAGEKTKEGAEEGRLAMKNALIGK